MPVADLDQDVARINVIDYTSVAWKRTRIESSAAAPLVDTRATAALTVAARECWPDIAVAFGRGGISNAASFELGEQPT